MLNTVKYFIFIFYTTTLMCSCANAEPQFDSAWPATSCVKIGNYRGAIAKTEAICSQIPASCNKAFISDGYTGNCKNAFKYKTTNSPQFINAIKAARELDMTPNRELLFGF